MTNKFKQLYLSPSFNNYYNHILLALIHQFDYKSRCTNVLHRIGGTNCKLGITDNNLILYQSSCLFSVHNDNEPDGMFTDGFS